MSRPDQSLSPHIAPEASRDVEDLRSPYYRDLSPDDRRRIAAHSLVDRFHRQAASLDHRVYGTEIFLAEHVELHAEAVIYLTTFDDKYSTGLREQLRG